MAGVELGGLLEGIVASVAVPPPPLSLAYAAASSSVRASPKVAAGAPGPLHRLPYRHNKQAFSCGLEGRTSGLEVAQTSI